MASISSVSSGHTQPVQTDRVQNSFSELTQKVQAVVFSRWGLVLVTAVFAAACFGALVGLGVCATASLISYMTLPKSNPAPSIPQQANPDSRSRAPLHLPRTRQANPTTQRERNIQIFNETLEMIRQGERVDMEQHEHMLVSSVVMEQCAPSPELGERDTEILVEPITSFEMAKKIVNRGYKPLVLDMANRYSHGGGVRNGATAQEEVLCRQSNLYPALEVLVDRQQYPLPEFGGAYIPNVQFFRDDAYNFVDPFTVDVFVSAAYNCNVGSRGYDKPENEHEYENGTRLKIQNMLRAAIQMGNRAVVLSAFGCGAFRNDTNFIAQIYREILNDPEFQGKFDIVAFGIYDPPAAEVQNCPIFERVLREEVV